MNLRYRNVNQTVGDVHPSCSECRSRFDCVAAKSTIALSIIRIIGAINWDIHFSPQAGLIVATYIPQQKTKDVHTKRGTGYQPLERAIIDSLSEGSVIIKIDSDIFREMLSVEKYLPTIQAPTNSDIFYLRHTNQCFLVAILVGLHRKFEEDFSARVFCKSHVALALATDFMLYAVDLGNPGKVPRSANTDPLGFLSLLKSYGFDDKISNKLLSWFKSIDP